MSNDQQTDETEFPIVDRVYVLKEVPSGEIRVEQGADGLFLLFDCDCIDALPVCQAQCCGLKGIGVRPEEEDNYSNQQIEWDSDLGSAVMIRGADGFCNCLDRTTRSCTIYQDRPLTCKAFHCTRGARVRGWKLPNGVVAHSGH